MAINAGASALGLVGPMPSGPGIISNKMIAEIAQTVAGQPVETFLLTSETTVEGIYNHYQKVQTTTIQLDEIEKNGHAQLKELLPEVKIIQVLHVLDEKTIDEAEPPTTQNGRSTSPPPTTTPYWNSASPARAGQWCNATTTPTCSGPESGAQSTPERP